MRTRERVVALAIGGLLTLSLCSSALADEVVIPFSIYVEDFKHDCASRGLNLYDQKTSDGFVENKGKSIHVFTYKNLRFEDLELIKEMAFKNMRK